MKKKKWQETVETTFYGVVAILWLILGSILTYYYCFTSEGIQIAATHYKFPQICFPIGIALYPQFTMNTFIRFGIFAIGMIALEAGVIL